MSGRVDQLEHRLGEVLPMSPTSESIPLVPELTKQLITAGDDVWRTTSYTHSVCHLFENYARGGASYLNATAHLPEAGELVDYTLKKAMEAGDYGCVGRIVHPIMNLNLAHLEENSEGFVFRPEIITDPDFIGGFNLSGETKYESSLIDFCRSGSIGEFFQKYVESLRKDKGLDPITRANEVLPGVFIDVGGTLIRYDHHDSNSRKSVYQRVPLTQEFALRKIEEGIPVTVFTGAHLEDVVEELTSAGVDVRLFDVKPKAEYIGRVLETCVDDTAPTIQGFRAIKHYNSGEMAWNTEYPKDK